MSTLIVLVAVTVSLVPSMWLVSPLHRQVPTMSFDMSAICCGGFGASSAFAAGGVAGAPAVAFGSAGFAGAGTGGFAAGVPGAGVAGLGAGAWATATPTPANSRLAIAMLSFIMCLSSLSLP